MPTKKTASLKKEPEQKIVLNKEFNEILDVLNTTTKSIFITGKAGTGKSTLLTYFAKNTTKKFVVLAPTGVAALNVGGQTIHSFFRFPPSVVDPQTIKPDIKRSKLFRNLDMIIIDEVSMVRADMMHGIDVSLRKNRNKPKEAFGGVQMVFIGDLFQLPPVLRDSDIEAILKDYGGQYFFDANVFKDFTYQFGELTTIFRQSNEQQQFKNLLNSIRNNSAKAKDLTLLNARHIDEAGKQRNSIFLTTRRNTARNLNMDKLDKLPGKEKIYTGELTGDYEKLLELGESKLEDKFPAPYKLQLKKDAQVMMIKNDPDKQWVNGSIGKVVKLGKDDITVDINGKKCTVVRELWEEVEYSYNNAANTIEEKVLSTFSQFPLQLSYAITIHKSQGKTFDKITIDTGSGAFAHGQIYVALSRCTTLEGIRLNNHIKASDIIVDPRITAFYNTRKIPASTDILTRAQTTIIPEAIMAVIQAAIKKSSNVKIVYQNSDGINSERQLSKLSISNAYGQNGYENQHIMAYCHTRKTMRTFNIARIREIEIVK